VATWEPVSTSGTERLHVAAAARVGVGTAITWVAWVAARALALVTLILLARTLPADDLGALLASIAAGLLGATLATGGLPDATARSAAAGTATGTFGQGDLWNAFLRFGATLPFVVVLLLLISQGSAGLDWGLLVASVLLALTQGGTAILAAVFRARGQAGRFALVTGLIVAIGRTAVGAVAFGLDLGADFVLWSFVALNVGLIAATWNSAARGLPRTRSHDEGATALHLGGAVWALLAHLDIVVVGVVLGADDAGVYGATLRLAELSYQFVFAVSVLYLPEAVKLLAAGDRSALVGLYRTSSRWSALISLLVAGAGFVAAPWLADVLFPDDAAISTKIMRILFVAYAVYGALGLGYLTSVAVGSFRQITQSALVALPAITAATVIGAELWGLTGAACATGASYIAFTLWWIWVTREKTLHATPFDGRYTRALVASALTLLGVEGVALLLDDAPPLVALPVLALVTACLWVPIVVLSGALSPPERRRLRRLVPWRTATP
jgi:O-antigen/teichoic acid export membrane protein